LVDRNAINFADLGTRRVWEEWITGDLEISVLGISKGGFSGSISI
jgi:hypothetical protein